MNKPIFITARFRTGSTMLWNIFRHLPETRTYYEPLNDNLRNYVKYPIDVEKSHLFVKSYFDEYLDIPEVVDLHQSDFSNSRLLLESQDSYRELYEYIRALVESVPIHKTAVLQFNRIDFRLPWIKKNYPDVLLLHLTRNPRDQWYSTLAAYNTNINENIDFDCYDLTTWARNLCKHFPFLATPRIEHAYQRFYYLWKLSYLAGKRLSDLSISYEDILSKPEEKVKEILIFANLFSDHNLDTCLKLVESKPDRIWKKDRNDIWFESIEHKCEALLDELGLNENFAILPVEEIIKQSKKYQELINDDVYNLWAENSYRKQITNERITCYEMNFLLKQGYKNAINEVDDIKKQLKQTQDERDTAQAELKQTQIERDTAQAELKQTQIERDTAQAELKQTQIERDITQTELKKTQAEFNTFITQLEQITTELKASQLILNQTQADRDQIREQLNDTLMTQETIKEELCHVYNSRSYRITAPLRAVFGVARIIRDRLIHRKITHKGDNDQLAINYHSKAVANSSIKKESELTDYQSDLFNTSICGDRDFNLDEIMEKIRQEIEGRATQTQNRTTEVISSTNLQETRIFRFIKKVQSVFIKIPFYKQIYGIAIKIKKYVPKYETNITVDDLIKYEGEEFIRNAYKVILKREPDSNGNNQYLYSLSTGYFSKIDILGRLRYSSEGRKNKVKIKGILVKFVTNLIIKSGHI